MAIKSALAMSAACVLLAACGGSSSDTDAPAPSATSALEAALAGCANDQQTVYDALQGTDAAKAQESLESAATSCRSAAAELRRIPLPTLDAVKGPAAIDQMADGLAEIARAVPMMDSAPGRARTKAQHGMHVYAAGLVKFNAAHRS
jgi:hypothetical protein